MFIRSAIDGQLGCLQCGAPMHNTIMNTSGQVCIWTRCHLSWKEPVPQRANAKVYGKRMFNLIKNAKPCPKAVVRIDIPTGNARIRAPAALWPASSC